MKAVSIHGGRGGPDALFVEEVKLPELRSHHVMIKVHATAINRADTMQREGKYPVPSGESEILGLEAAGTVESLGPEVTKWKIGDRVMSLLAGGGYAEYVTAHEGHVMPIPNSLSFVEAAAIPETWLTAYQLLHFVGRVKSNETVLIHAGGSGVGTAAVQLCKLAGVTSFVTAGTQDKIDLAVSLGAVAGFNYKKGKFVHDVIKATNGRGVDVILDCVGGSFWEQNADSLGIDGRWVVYGSLGGGSVNGDILAKILRKRLTVIGTTLRSRSIEYKSRLVSDFSAATLGLFSQGLLRPVISQILPFSDVAKAHRVMESNTNMGKLILQVILDKHGKAEL